MENNIGREEWIERVMGSTQGIRRAEPASDLYDRVTDRMNRGSAVKTMPFPVARWVAAAILLLALNIGSILHYTNISGQAAPSGTPAQDPLANYIQTESTYNY